DRAGPRDPRLATRGPVQGAGAQAGFEHDPQPGGTLQGGARPFKERIPPVQINGMFSEIDAYARSSPAQANHARQTEAQSQEMTADGGAAAGSGARPGMERIQYESPTEPVGNWRGPVITPKGAGGGFAASQPGVAPRNAISTVDFVQADTAGAGTAP